MAHLTDSIKQQIWVAIDVAKDKHDILIEYPNKTQKRLVIRNTQSDYQRLLSAIDVNEQTSVRVGFEATGDYHRCLIYFLAQAGLTCHLISSIATARTREIMYQTWDKHDKKDATVILHLLKSGFTQYYYDPLIEQTHDIQELSNTYHQVSKRKTRLQHSLKNHYLTLYFPEAEKFMHSTRANWFINLLIAFPCPASIVALSQHEFVEKASLIKGRKTFKRQWLNEFYGIAINSIGLPVLPESTTMNMFRIILNEYLAICQRRDAIEQQATEQLTNCGDYQRLQTIPGIGPVIVLTILAEAGNLKRFRHYKQFLNFCGFNLSTQRSGTLCGQTKLSKRGNARLRQVLWMAAQIAVQQHENSFRNKFKAYLRIHGETPDTKRKAYTAVAIKMARVIHSLSKQQTDYRGYYESS